VSEIEYEISRGRREGEDRMDILVIAVIAIAVAQALTILLTIGREREIKRLRGLVAEQRILIVEIRAWLTGRMQSAQPRRIKPDREPIADMRVPEPAMTRVPEPAITPKDLPDTIRTTEEETARVMKAVNWLNEVRSAQPRRMKPDGDQPMADVPALAITPKDLPERPRLTEDEIKEMMGADKAREIVSVLHGTPPKKIE
jgi:hypothetical protein